MEDTDIKKTVAVKVKRNSSPNQLANLTDRHLTKENARELQAIGAKKRKENTARRRSMQDIAKWLGNLALNKKELKSVDEIVDLENAQAINMTANEAMMLAIFQRALLGDVACAQFIRDTAGEKPVDQLAIGGMTIEDYAKQHKVKF